MNHKFVEEAKVLGQKADPSILAYFGFLGLTGDKQPRHNIWLRRYYKRKFIEAINNFGKN